MNERTSPSAPGGTLGKLRPIASSAVQPKTASAAGFQDVTVPSRSSVTIGAGDPTTMARRRFVVAPRRFSASFRSVRSMTNATDSSRFSPDERVADEDGDARPVLPDVLLLVGCADAALLRLGDPLGVEREPLGRGDVDPPEGPDSSSLLV